jgi:hypothetical protein
MASMGLPFADRGQAFANLRIGAGRRRAVIVRCQQGDGRTGFGKAVGIGEIGIGKQPHGAFDHRQRHLAAAIGDSAQR